MDQLKEMKEKLKENVQKQNALLEESAKVAELQSAGYWNLIKRKFIFYSTFKFQVVDLEWSKLFLYSTIKANQEWRNSTSTTASKINSQSSRLQF